MKFKAFAIGMILASATMGVFATEVAVDEQVAIIEQSDIVVESDLIKEVTVLNGLDSTIIKQDNEVYVPLNSLAEILGLAVTYSEEGIDIAVAPEIITPIMSMPLVSMPVNLPEDAQIIERAVIKTIDEDMNQITILPVDLEDEVTNYITLNISEETGFTSGLGVMADYIEGMLVTVAHSPMMTHSMVPQSAALVINPVMDVADNMAVDPNAVVPNNLVYNYDEDGNIIGHSYVMENVEIIEVTKDDDGNVVSITVGDAADYMTQTIFIVDSEQTNIKHFMNRMAYTADALEVGQIVNVSYGETMTLSLPPKTAAFEIVLVGPSN
ncbi:MAG: hypothetical protein ATN33_05935 [Epulopiscium sp. Nele67-Bin001]|nr:MAG: hypothetical protein ATN33_05935 [Epulopiscium sp. Nele67-Bin001]